MPDDLLVLDLGQPFDTNENAEQWFVNTRWPDGVRCARCDSERIHETPYHHNQPYRCSDCKRYFSVKTRTVMQGSKLPHKTWAMAILLLMTEKVGINSYELADWLKVTQKTAWSLAQKIREGFRDSELELYSGPVEVDETYIGGRARNQPKERKQRLKKKSVVIGMIDRDTGKVRVKHIDRAAGVLQCRFIYENTIEWIEVYTDEHKGYTLLRRRKHSTVNHSAGEYGLTNQIESFWSGLKRGVRGVYLHWSPKHLHRYLVEYQERYNLRGLTGLEKMEVFLRRSVGRKLTYTDLIADGSAYPPIKR